YHWNILLCLAILSFLILSLLLWQKLKHRQNALFRNLFHYHSSMILLLDSDKHLIKGANVSAAKFLGYSDRKLEGMPVTQLFPDYSGSETGQIEILLANNIFKTVKIQASPSSFNKKNIELIIFQDVTDSVKIKMRYTLHTLVMQKLVEGAPLKIILNAILNTLEEADSNMICSILLTSADGKHLLPGAAPSLPDFYNAAVNNLPIGDGVGSCGTAAYTRKRVTVEDIATHPYWSGFTELAAKAGVSSCWSEPIFGIDNTLLGTFGIYHAEPCTPTKEDFQLIEYVTLITAIAIERSKTSEQLKLSDRVFSNTHEGIAITDVNKNIIEVNPAFCEITGYERHEVIGKNPSMLSSGQQSSEFYQSMWNTIDEKGHWQGEVWNRKKTGELYAELLTISSLKDINNQVINYVGMFTDITHSKQQQEKLNLMAHYDVLTELPNRALFVDRFNQAIAHSKRTKTQLAVCFLDVDNFKPINDNFGHEVGDQLLIQVANRISCCVREGDTISRQGGDEFALLLSDISSYAQCEKTLIRILNNLSQPYDIKGVNHSITVSCGVTVYPSDNSDIDTLVRHADQAMYKAKQSGRNQYQLFNTAHAQEAVQKHLRLDEIKQAIINHELVLYYQAKVNMRTGDVYGAEALIRWIHPKKGLIPPLDFLPLIDGTELEIEIGNWVLKQAVQQIAIWHEMGIKLQISVNIASYHLQSNNFFSYLETLLENYPEIKSSLLQLEILESSVLSDVTIISHIIKRCQTELGVSIALDDFGTGYSSLTHLRSLPANIIKIDQSFVRDILDDPNDYTIIDGIVRLAESFNRGIIAEGVESTSHGIVLLNMGCDHAQGYGIAKPMPAEKLESWLSSYKVNQHWVEFAKQESSKEERYINLMKLTCQRWQVKFTEQILSPNKGTTHWPFMGSRECHCGHWIKQVKNEALFDIEWLKQLDSAHEKVHAIAKSLQLSYEENNEIFNKEKLAKFNKAFKEMSNILPK
ncbi:MAG: EAL domain-containing protein, partial [Methyloprofundus sp.]|nr:EAL domain-containing protein [Methyloprofundus sp.]